MAIHSIDAEDDQFAYRYDTQLLIDRRDEDLDEDAIADYITEHFEGNSLIAAGDEDLIKIQFHTNEQWKILEGEVFPKLIKTYGKNLKVWSAACSTGDEPYSLVMALSRQIPLANIKVIATDIDKQVLDKARMGLYNEKSIANVPKDLKDKYFKKIGTSYQISDEIKRRVEFKEHNLLKDPYPTGCNLIVCRNVVIYFTEEAKDEIYKKFNQCMTKGGVLFIGSTEQIMNYKELGFVRDKSFFFEKE